MPDRDSNRLRDRDREREREREIGRDSDTDWEQVLWQMPSGLLNDFKFAQTKVVN